MANNPRTINGTAEVTTLPMQAALLAQAGLPPELQAMMLEEMRETLEARKAARTKKEKQALANAEAAQESARQKAQEQGRCSHLKQDGTTRLGGQYISGTGQLFLTCQFCHIEYHSPALKGQVEPPRHLIPPADQIGG